MTLAVINVCWMVVRMEGANPPETLVPRLTHKRVKVRDRPQEVGETSLDSPVQHNSNLGCPAGQVKVAGWAMTYPGIPLLDQH